MEHIMRGEHKYRVNQHHILVMFFGSKRSRGVRMVRAILSALLVGRSLARFGIELGTCHAVFSHADRTPQKP